MFRLKFHFCILPAELLERILSIIYCFFSHFYFPASGQAVVTGVAPSFPRSLPSVFIADRVQQSHCSWIFHRVLLTNVLALSSSQFLHKKSQRLNTSTPAAGLELTKLTYTRLGDNLIRHRGRPAMQNIGCYWERVTMKFQKGHNRQYLVFALNG